MAGTPGREAESGFICRISGPPTSRIRTSSWPGRMPSPFLPVPDRTSNIDHEQCPALGRQVCNASSVQSGLRSRRACQTVMVLVLIDRSYSKVRLSSPWRLTSFDTLQPLPHDSDTLGVTLLNSLCLCNKATIPIAANPAAWFKQTFRAKQRRHLINSLRRAFGHR